MEAAGSARSRVVVVVQARMSSTRLPGKVLRPLGGRPVLDWVLAAATAAREVDEVVVAISTDPTDDPLEGEVSRHRGVRLHRGPLEDVLSRFVGATERTGAAAVVRLTADCPLLDPAVIDLLVRTWRATPELDHLSTTNPRCLPRGLDVEVVSARALREVATYAEGPDRVHVTSAVYRQPERYLTAGLSLHPDASDLRVTLDTSEDGALLDALVPLLPSGPPPWRAVVAALRARPDIAALNSGVEQKAWAEG